MSVWCNYRYRHIKLIKKAIEERTQKLNPPETVAEEVIEKKEVEESMIICCVNNKDENKVGGLMGLNESDPIMKYISGMEMPKPEINEKKLKRQEKRRARQRAQDEKDKLVLETQNRERELETIAINNKVADLHLRVKEVAADGNCLFRALAEQLAIVDPLMKSPSAYRVLRRKAANYLRDHEDDFCYFLEDDVDYNMFCDKVECSNGLIVILW